MVNSSIVQIGADILNKKLEPVSSVEEALEIGSILKNYIDETKTICYGLAACQIGIDKQVFISLDLSKSIRGKQVFKIFANPTIVESKAPFKSTEGCLSIPKFQYVVDRFNDIVVEDLIQGQKRYLGLEATILQHEIDHLNGILINKKGA